MLGYTDSLITFMVKFPSSKAALTTVGYTLKDAEGQVTVSRTTSNVINQGFGYFSVSLSFASARLGFILWDTGEVSPIYAQEDFNILALPTDGIALVDIPSGAVSPGAMDLLSLIVAFREQTGRLDFTDAQIIAILNNASRLLDQFDTSLEQETRYYHTISANSYTAVLPVTTRWIKAVNLIYGNTSKELYFSEAQILRPLLIASDAVGTGLPDTYCRLNARLADNPLGQDLDFALDLDALSLDTAAIRSYLLVYPVPNVDVILEVVGYFFSPALTLVSPENKWTVSYPDLLLQACEYVMTKNLLNIEESIKLKVELQNAMKEIVFDSYMNEDISSMEG